MKRFFIPAFFILSIIFSNLSEVAALGPSGAVRPGLSADATDMVMGNPGGGSSPDAGGKLCPPGGCGPTPPMQPEGPKSIPAPQHTPILIPVAVPFVPVPVLVPLQTPSAVSASSSVSAPQAAGSDFQAIFPTSAQFPFELNVSPGAGPGDIINSHGNSSDLPEPPAGIGDPGYEGDAEYVCRIGKCRTYILSFDEKSHDNIRPVTICDLKTHAFKKTEWHTCSIPPILVAESRTKDYLNEYPEFIESTPEGPQGSAPSTPVPDGSNQPTSPPVDDGAGGGSCGGNGAPCSPPGAPAPSAPAPIVTGDGGLPKDGGLKLGDPPAGPLPTGGGPLNPPASPPVAPPVVSAPTSGGGVTCNEVEEVATEYNTEVCTQRFADGKCKKRVPAVKQLIRVYRVCPDGSKKFLREYTKVKSTSTGEPAVPGGPSGPAPTCSGPGCGGGSNPPTCSSPSCGGGARKKGPTCSKPGGCGGGFKTPSIPKVSVPNIPRPNCPSCNGGARVGFPSFLAPSISSNITETGSKNANAPVKVNVFKAIGEKCSIAAFVSGSRPGREYQDELLATKAGKLLDQSGCVITFTAQTKRLNERLSIAIQNSESGAGHLMIVDTEVPEVLAVNKAAIELLETVSLDGN